MGADSRIDVLTNFFDLQIENLSNGQIPFSILEEFELKKYEIIKRASQTVLSHPNDFSFVLVVPCHCFLSVRDLIQSLDLIEAMNVQQAKIQIQDYFIWRTKENKKELLIDSGIPYCMFDVGWTRFLRGDKTKCVNILEEKGKSCLSFSEGISFLRQKGEAIGSELFFYPKDTIITEWGERVVITETINSLDGRVIRFFSRPIGDLKKQVGGVFWCRERIRLSNL